MEQEPQLDEQRTVIENVTDGVREQADLLQRFDEISMAMGEPGADFDGLRPRASSALSPPRATPSTPLLRNAPQPSSQSSPFSQSMPSCWRRMTKMKYQK